MPRLSPSSILEQIPLVPRDRQIGVNVGVLGHVDCGKTSLCIALSTHRSTAAFDSSPQSVERGITLDLGFSAFPLDDTYNVTLVDCPGHASLIRTVLGGIRIMDLMILVVDATKGMQSQTWECLILADLVPTSTLIIALNKVDLIPLDAREVKLEKIRSLMRKTLKKTRFGSNTPMVMTSVLDKPDGTYGTDHLKEEILKLIRPMKFERDVNSPFIMAVDHCFSVKGVGAVCTGTILQGAVHLNDNVEFPSLQATNKVKTIQIFKEPVLHATAGDRVALGIPGADSKSVERGIVTAPGLLPLASRLAILRVHKIPFFKDPVLSGKRYHFSIGYSTVTCMVTFFTPNSLLRSDDDENFNRSKEYVIKDCLAIDNDDDNDDYSPSPAIIYFAMIYFDKPVFLLPNTWVIASNLQQKDQALACRLAFHGRVIETSQDKDYLKTYVRGLKLFCFKRKRGVVDRVSSPTSVIVRGFCQKNSNIDHLLGLMVTASVNCNGVIDKVCGKIEGRFGKTDKLRVNLDQELSAEYIDCIKKNGSRIELEFKVYKFGPKSKKLCQ